MVERVARAIAQADEQNGGAPYEYRITLGKHAKEHLFDEARAAVKAIRDIEPNEAMMSAMWSLNFANTKESFAACWQALLDAALGDQP